MESSYKIIKSSHVDNCNNKFLIDTNTDSIEEEKILDIEEDQMELDLSEEDKLRLFDSIDEYKRKVNKQIESERKNILEAARIDAEKQAIKIREAAKNLGYSEGYSRAIEEAKREASKIKSDALDFIYQAKEFRDTYISEQEKNIYKLAKTMAENIIDYVVDIEDENILLLIRPILNEYIKEEEIIISANARGKQMLERYRDKLLTICPNTKFIFLQDKSIDKNGFIIENKESTIDLQIRLQLENMLKEISDEDE